MHDVVNLEREHGIPAVALVSSAFGSQALYQARALGHTEAERSIAIVRHPISNATPRELLAKTKALYPELVRSLTSELPPSKALQSSMGISKPSEVCLLGG